MRALNIPVKLSAQPDNTPFGLAFRHISGASRVGLIKRALINLHCADVPHFIFPAPHFTSPVMHHDDSFQNGCAIGSRFQCYTVAIGVYFLPNYSHMSIGCDHHWDIARRFQKDVSRRVALYDQIENITQANALEEQGLLFGGRQLEDGIHQLHMKGANAQHVLHRDLVENRLELTPVAKVA